MSTYLIHHNPPLIMNTLIINILYSTLIFSAAYHWLVKPVLPQLKPRLVLIPILLLESFRHLGLMFLTTGVTSTAMPQQFAVPAAAGDFLSGTLAFIAAFLIHRKHAYAAKLAWLFTIVGLADFVMAIALSRIYSAGDYLGGAYWIPSFWVPMLLIGHLIVIQVLRQMKHQGVSFSA
jgi:hypothetical protein